MSSTSSNWRAMLDKVNPRLSGIASAPWRQSLETFGVGREASDADQLAITLKTLKTPIRLAELAKVVEWEPSRIADAILDGEARRLIIVHKDGDDISVEPR